MFINEIDPVIPVLIDTEMILIKNDQIKSKNRAVINNSLKYYCYNTMFWTRSLLSVKSVL